jgi:hypothetical protein
MILGEDSSAVPNEPGLKNSYVWLFQKTGHAIDAARKISFPMY